MAKMTVSQARAQMREAIEKVKAGEEVEITQNGEVVAVWVHPSKRRPIVRTPSTMAAQRLHRELERSREAKPPISSPAVRAEHAEELVRQVRADRESASLASRCFRSTV